MLHNCQYSIGMLGDHIVMKLTTIQKWTHDWQLLFTWHEKKCFYCVSSWIN